MKKKFGLVLVFILVMTIAIKVNAREWYEAETIIEKGESINELYNAMPTEIKKGDIVKVNVVVKSAKDLQLIDGYNDISFDSDVFEPVEIDGKYYGKLSDNIRSVGVYYRNSNIAVVYYVWEDDTIETSDTEYVAELYFKVKNTAKDGVYRITQVNNNLDIYVNDSFEETPFNTKLSLQYQLGKSKLKSIYSKEFIENNSYVIGDHLFTREKNDDYDGIMRTEYIMLAAKTIQSNAKEDMIIYSKNARGNWVNAITGDSIETPSEFDIEYVNMQPSFRENGIYADSNEVNIIRFIQISNSKAIVTIENDKERIHGIADMIKGANSKTVDLSFDNKYYTINILDNEIKVTTNDQYFPATSLQKKSNNTINEYFLSVYGELNMDSDPIYYLNSSQTGKYTYGNYELYFLRTHESDARVCIKEKNGDECLIDEYAMLPGYLPVPTIPDSILNATYAMVFESGMYGLTFNGNNILVQYDGCGGNNPLVGTYTKASSLSIEDTFDVWEKNEKYYYVKMSTGDENQDMVLTVPAGKTLIDNLEGYVTIDLYKPYKASYNFIEWRLDGNAYDFTAKVNKPMTLVAYYEEKPHACYIHDGNEYTWTNNPDNSSWVVADGITTANECVAPEPSFCYKDIDGIYHWTNDPESSWQLLSLIVTEDACVTPYACYDDGLEYKWSNTPSILWTEKTEITTEDACVTPNACYIDGSSEYHWTNNPESSWTRLNDIDSQDNCRADTNACYFNESGNNYIWGEYENVAGYIPVTSAHTQAECIPATAPCCATNGNGLSMTYNNVVTCNQKKVLEGYSVTSGACSANSCTAGTAGTYQDGETCTVCQEGYYCEGNNASPVACPAGTGSAFGSTSAAACVACEGDTYSTGGMACTACPSGHHANGDHTGCIDPTQ